MKLHPRQVSPTSERIYIILPPSSKDHPRIMGLKRLLALSARRKTESPYSNYSSDDDEKLLDYQQALATAHCCDFYLLRVDRPLKQNEMKLLRRLKRIRDSQEAESRIEALSDFDDTKDFLLFPRAGTCSPWSSKANAILKEIFPAARMRIEKGFRYEGIMNAQWQKIFCAAVQDKMTETIVSMGELFHFFDKAPSPPAMRYIDMTNRDQLNRLNAEWGLALSPQELDYLMGVYKGLERPATDVELMGYSQLNSEHCRHKVFNSVLYFNQEEMPATLFGMIKHTSKVAATGLISAYKDNAAIFATRTTDNFYPQPTACGIYETHRTQQHLVFKAETHNHPTFVSPYPGAATGVGGEIRDELACGRGARTKAGFVGFSVSDIASLPSLNKEDGTDMPADKASGIEIMLQAPLGGSNYGNEFGRPCLGGYFRTLRCKKNGAHFGYHKPIMLAGGWGEILSTQVNKGIDPSRGQTHLIVLGEAALRIGIGGSSISSMKSDAGSEDLDFASVQRDNAEMERRCAEVIYQCTQYGENNPIQFIHDVGAGGVGNALTELLKDNDCGGDIVLENIPIADRGMSPLEIWNNESQERFVLAVGGKDLELFDKIARREDTPYRVLGHTTQTARLRVISQSGREDMEAGTGTTNNIIDLPLCTLFPQEKLRREGQIPAGTSHRASRNNAQPDRISDDGADVSRHDSLNSDGSYRGISTPIGLNVKHKHSSDNDKATAPVQQYPDSGGSTGAAMASSPQPPNSERAGTMNAAFPQQSIRMEKTSVAASGSAKSEYSAAHPRSLAESAAAILRVPAVASKSFLITINDRSVGGLTAREQLIGPWQQPVSDYAGTLLDYQSCAGEVSALGERTPVAVLNPSAAARLALAEVITNLAASGIRELSDIRLCANWMASVEDEGQLYDLYTSVQAVAQDLCPTLELAIPVGKDSLSMNAQWQEQGGGIQRIISPISLVMSGLAPVEDMRLGVTPQLSPTGSLYLVSLQSPNAARLGGSAYSQMRNQWEEETPDLNDPQQLKSFFDLIRSLTHERIITAYHDISDGGLWTTLCEMAYAANCGLDVRMEALMEGRDAIARQLFNEELGGVAQVRPEREEEFHKMVKKTKGMSIYRIGKPSKEDRIQVIAGNDCVLDEKMTELRAQWYSVSDHIRMLRDNHHCVQQEQRGQWNYGAPGLREDFDEAQLRRKRESIAALRKERPRIAILRTHGINGQREMAAAFSEAGFDAYDVHINDLLNGDERGLANYKGIAFCGGFSYGDALGAGSGWAASILLHPRLRDLFEEFFTRPDTFTLGICNGCQALAKMQEIIPGANWNCEFKLNQSHRFESRTVMMKIAKSNSIFLREMEDSLLPVASAHGEGRAVFDSPQQTKRMKETRKAALFYADSYGNPTQEYPLNPNGSAGAIAGLTSKDGRVTLMMPHPERVFLRLTQCWRNPVEEDNAQRSSPWHTMFLNARLWVG